MMKPSNFLKESPFDISEFIIVNLPIGIFRSSPGAEGKFLLANPALVKMFEYDNLEEFLKLTVMDLYVNPRDRKELIKELETEGQVHRKVYQLRKKSGETFWGAITVKTIANDLKEPFYFDGAIEDITDIKEKELRLTEERNFFEAVIEALPGLFWLNDENGKSVRWNKNVEKVYGYTSDELTKLHALKDITSEETLPALLEATKRALAGGSGYCEYDIKTKSGKQISFAGDARLVTIKNKKYLATIELDISKRKEVEKQLREALEEIRRLKDKTDAENVYLMDEIHSETSSEYIVGRSSKLNKMLQTAKKVAPTSTTVLIQGETGTGKGLLANFIHNNSPRANRPLIKLNCANLPVTLIESILFGHEKGAFTNASSSKIGRFELADGSTIFLDEIAELPLELQSKLLRVIEESEFERLGGTKTISVDIRIIAATNRNLEEEVKAGNFRQDLLFRLNVYPITTPPLRERKTDIPLLMQFFINKFNKSLGKSISEIPNIVLDQAQDYTWPGNIRELQNVVERAMINSTGKALNFRGISTIVDLPEEGSVGKHKTMKDVEIQHITKILKHTNWVIEGERGAAKILDLNASTLRGRMRKLGIQRPAEIPRF